jgi:two-component system, OmpR family, sensor histidine kinase KdpD
LRSWWPVKSGSRLHADARRAWAGERREATVARVARDLSGALQPEQIVTVCRETIAPLFEAKIALILPDSGDRLHASGTGGFEEMSVAQWTYHHVQRAGRGTGTLDTAEALYLPLKAPIRCRGVLAIQPQDWRFLEGSDDKRLLEASCSSIALALERIHLAEVAQDTLVRMQGVHRGYPGYLLQCGSRQSRSISCLRRMRRVHRPPSDPGPCIGR